MASDFPCGDVITQQKHELRAQVIARRDAMDPILRARKSSTICSELASAIEASLSACLEHRPVVAVYSPMGSEVNLHELITRLYAAQVRVAFPAMPPALQDGQRMQMRIVSHADYLSGTVPFIAHPTRPFPPDIEASDEKYPVVVPREIDAIAVPLVGFDSSGMRLGYGGGCYDRYLPKLQARCFVAGVAFNEQQVTHVSADTFDLPLPRIISS